MLIIKLKLFFFVLVIVVRIGRDESGCADLFSKHIKFQFIISVPNLLFSNYVGSRISNIKITC